MGGYGCFHVIRRGIEPLLKGLRSFAISGLCHLNILCSLIILCALLSVLVGCNRCGGGGVFLIGALSFQSFRTRKDHVIDRN